VQGLFTEHSERFLKRKGLSSAERYASGARHLLRMTRERAAFAHKVTDEVAKETIASRSRRKAFVALFL
jgi:hypothetical protein